MYGIIEQFLVEVFGDEELEGGRLVIMTRPEDGKPTHQFFKDPIAAAKYADSIEGRHVYFGLGIFHPETTSRSQDNTVGMAAFGVDIDVQGLGHQRSNLCPSKEEAVAFLKEAVPGCPPSIIIDSGHGIQGFFVFKEPYMFRDAEDREEVYATAHALHRAVQFHAGRNKWHIDSVFDLARVMRLPGTMNIKVKDEPKLVAIIENSWPKYGSPMDFDGLVVAEDDRAKARAAFDVDRPYYTSELQLMLYKDAMAPAEKLADLLEAEPRFKAAWHCRRGPGRPDKEEDLSLSSLDMTLANYAVKYGWPDQEIANLIIEFRRRNGTKRRDLDKAIREDYIERTIVKARQAYAELVEDKEKESEWASTARSITSARNAGIKVEKADDIKEKARKAVSAYFGFPVEKLIRYQGTLAEYALCPVNGKPIKLGKSTTLTSQQLLACAVMDQTNKVLEKKKGTAFHNVLTAMMALVEDVATSEDADEDRLLAKRIRDYWQYSTVALKKDDGYKRRVPFIWEKRGYVFGEELRRFIKTSEDEKVQARQLGMLMSQIGCEAKKVHFSISNGTKMESKNTTVYDVTPVLNPAWLLAVEDDNK